MSVSFVLDQLNKKSGELDRSIPISWQYPPRPPKRPLSAAPSPSWPTFSKVKPIQWKVNGKNWFYADITFPKQQCGIEFKETQALIFINGWQPFTLWINGTELFKENHAWLATGPIANPFPMTVDPGKTYHLVVCVEPTDIPALVLPLDVQIKSRRCVELGIEVMAASAQLHFAQALARTKQEKKLLEQAVACIDVKALESDQWDRFFQSTKKMETALSPLSARAKKTTVHLVGHSHIDMDWMWTWKDTVNCIRRDFKSVTDLMDDYPEVTFTHSQVPTYDVVRKMDPDVFRKVKNRIKEGRWENAAGTWVEGDLCMADGESVARHMLYAADWTTKHLDSKARVLWEPDTFMHPGNMPQLAKLGEFDCYFHMRCNPGNGNNWPVRVWEGVDGTPAVAFSMPYNSMLTPLQIVDAAIKNSRFGIKNALKLWGIGDHGGALSRFQLNLLSLYRDKPLFPTIKFSTMKHVLTAVRNEKVRLPRNKGETYPVFEGCFTTHADVKKHNRRGESALLTAEALCAMAGLDRKDDLRDAWLPVLFNQFHDIFDGTSVHRAYINADKRGKLCLKIARRVTQEAVSVLSCPAQKGQKLVLYNPLGFERTEPVRAALPEGTKCLIDSDGQVIPVQRIDREFMFVAENVPAFSRKTFRILKNIPRRSCFPDVSVNEASQDTWEVETKHAVSHLLKASGVIGSFYDKSLGREIIGYGMAKLMTYSNTARTDLALNVFQVLDEAPNSMSAWIVNNILQEQNLMGNAKVTFLDRGPVFARFRVVHAFRSSRIAEEIVYFNNVNRVDFKAQIDWHEKGDDKVGVPQLKVAFTTSMRRPRARFEGPFCVPERPTNGLDQPTQKWADLSGTDFGFTLLNDCKYGYDALGGRMRISLLRSPYCPDRDPDNGRHIIRFAFVPHGPGIPNADLVRAGMAYNRPLVPVNTNARIKPVKTRLQTSGSESIVCTALRIAEHSSQLLIRFFETSGKNCNFKFTLGSGIRSAREVNFLENPVAGNSRLRSGRVHTGFRPFEVKTFLVT